MSEATYIPPEDGRFNLLAASSIAAGQVIQLPTGQVAYLDQRTAVSSGTYTDQLRTTGKANLAKATSVVLVPGQEVYWDHSANNVTYKKVNDRDFFVGTVLEDADAAQTWCVVDLNKRQRFDYDLFRDSHLTTIVGTQGLNTMGLWPRGGARKFILSSTNEAQKVDALGVEGFATGANAIIEGMFRVVSDGAGTAPDFNIGVANDTHATDADSITDSIFIHLNGNEVNVYAESDDGTTEVAATDTIVDYTESATYTGRVHFLIDMRNPADVQIIVNGALVLDSTTFNVNASVATWRLLVHLEKTAAADVYEIDVDFLRCWLSEQ